MANKVVVSDVRVSTLIDAPEVATPAEVAALAQEVIDARQASVANGLNVEVIAEQRLEIVRLQARLELLVKLVSETPVDDIIANAKRASAAACTTAHEVEVEASVPR